MDWIRDEDIQPMWAKNYPRRKDNANAYAVCAVLTAIIRDKAESLTSSEEFEEKLNQTLKQFGIPKDAFEQFEKEELPKKK